MRFALAICLLLAITSRGQTNYGDPTLRHYLANSDLVVAGVMMFKSVGVVWETGVVHYVCDITISEVLKGKVPAEEALRVRVVRFESESGDRLPYFTEQGKCILFLKDYQGVTLRGTADPWFGIQPYNFAMAKSLKRLAEEGIAK